MAFKTTSMTSSFLGVDVKVKFHYEYIASSPLHIREIEQYEIGEISFYVKGVDITVIVWETIDFNEQEWIEKCVKYLVDKRSLK